MTLASFRYKCIYVNSCFLLNSKHKNFKHGKTPKCPNFTRPHVCKNKHFPLDVGSQISGLGQYKLLGKRTWHKTRFDVVSFNKQTFECQEIKATKQISTIKLL